MKAIFLTSPELMDEWWDRAAVEMDRVVSHAARGEFTTEDIKRLCEEKRAYIAVVVEGEDVLLAMAFEFVFYPRMTACNIMALGGKRLNDIASVFFVTFKNWCYNMGVTVIEASCSSVMARKLAGLGFEKTYEVVRHEIRLPREPGAAEL